MAKEEVSPDEPVWMKHAGIDAIGGPVPRHSFEGHYRDQGWEEVEPAVVAATNVLGGEVSDLSTLTKDQLEEVAAGRGLDTSSAKTKADLLSLIESSV